MVIDDRRRTDRRFIGGSKSLPPAESKRKPSPSERRDGRDRRKTIGVRIKTFSSLVKIREWLEEYASGATHIIIEDVDAANHSSTIVVTFEFERDKILFLDNFAKL